MADRATEGRCDVCGATIPDIDAGCPVCEAANPYSAPAQPVGRPSMRAGWLWLLILCVPAVVLSFMIVPGIGAPLVIMAITAAFRARSGVMVRALESTREVTSGIWLAEIFKSVAVTVSVGMATIIAFFLTCTASFALFGSNDLFTGLLMAILIVVPAIVFMFLMRITWPRHPSFDEPIDDIHPADESDHASAP